MNGYPAAALPPAHIAWPILVVLVLEYVLWPFLTQFVPDEPRCPLCKTLFRWSAIDTYDKGGRRQPRPFSFPCPDVPADHRSTELAQVFFAGFVSRLNRDLYISYL